MRSIADEDDSPETETDSLAFEAPAGDPQPSQLSAPDVFVPLGRPISHRNIQIDIDSMVYISGDDDRDRSVARVVKLPIRRRGNLIYVQWCEHARLLPADVQDPLRTQRCQGEVFITWRYDWVPLDSVEGCASVRYHVDGCVARHCVRAWYDDHGKRLCLVDPVETARQPRSPNHHMTLRAKQVRKDRQASNSSGVMKAIDPLRASVAINRTVDQAQRVLRSRRSRGRRGF